MPWLETRVMDQRMKFVVEHQCQEQSMAELCRLYDISRKTGYKWLDRWQQEGVAGLADRSRVPRHNPNRVPLEQVAAILAMRDRYRWGPKKLRVLLQREHPGQHWPALSTMQQILKEHGRVISRKKRRRVPPHTQPFAACDGPNAVWCCDFKGHFATGPGRTCYPLTISDAFSRYLLRCQGLYKTDGQTVRPLFEWSFREYGLPSAIRSDNGSPFASRAVAGLSRLSVWWIKLGIVPERIEPGKPQQNGRHERMHLTLKQATALPPATTPRKQQHRFDRFREEYNHIRPHEALAMQPPASLYQPSTREYPRREPEIVYASQWPVRKIDRWGSFYWKRQHVFLSEVLRGEHIGLAAVDERYYRTYFGPMWLGVFDSHTRKMLTAAELRRRPALKPGDPEERPSATLQDAPQDR